MQKIMAILLINLLCQAGGVRGMHWASTGDAKYGLLPVSRWERLLQQQYGKGKIYIGSSWNLTAFPKCQNKLWTWAKSIRTQLSPPASYPSHRRLPSEKQHSGTRTHVSEQPGVHTFWRLCGGATPIQQSISLAQDDGACRIGDNLVEDDISFRQGRQDQGCPRGQVGFVSAKLQFMVFQKYCSDKSEMHYWSIIHDIKDISEKILKFQ